MTCKHEWYNISGNWFVERDGNTKNKILLFHCRNCCIVKALNMKNIPVNTYKENMTKKQLEEFRIE